MFRFGIAQEVGTNDAQAIVASMEQSLLPQRRWAIATEWVDDWPTGWHYASMDQFEQVGEWTLVHGHIELPSGVWLLRDSQRVVRPGLVECVRRWHWTGDEAIEPVTLSVLIDAPNGKPFLPSINYYDNPAGQAIDATRIPWLGDESGNKGFYEEHRFSMPFAALESEDMTVVLHSQPSPIRYGNRQDQWWSLGVERRSGECQIGIYSGPVASNEWTGVIKARQKEFVDYRNAFCRVEPGAIIEKRFWVESYRTVAKGQGFRQALRTSAQLFCSEDPSAANLPSFRNVVGRKFYDTLDRWREGEGYAGFDAFPDVGIKRPWIDLGWAGQSEAVAYPLLLLGDEYQLERAQELAVKATNFITQKAVFDKRGFRIRYDYDQGKWLPRSNPLSQAQALDNLFSTRRIALQKNVPVADWDVFLQRAAEFHAKRILAENWKPVSTNEAFLIKPLTVAYEVFGDETLLEAARKAADHYGQRHLSMEEPYWGGTLDARCEDKEGAWAAFQGFLAMYEATREEKYLDWASHAADVILSYVYVWDVALPPGRLSDHNLRTRGWTSVSVQNMHLDVFGVIMAPSLWRLGELKQDPWYQHMAKWMILGCGQLVDAEGGQGEQLHQTNYAQRYTQESLRGIRGDYIEEWKVFWITAHFLNAAAQFEELGVDWRQW